MACFFFFPFLHKDTRGIRPNDPDFGHNQSSWGESFVSASFDTVCSVVNVLFQEEEGRVGKRFYIHQSCRRIENDAWTWRRQMGR